MYNMFQNCFSLTHLDLSSFYTPKLNDTSSMFANCKSIISLNLIGFDTQKIVEIYSMFENCSSLAYLIYPIFIYLI